ncbi:MAG: thioredoxin family protein [Candidatus Thiodiazotropha endolucinida]
MKQIKWVAILTGSKNSLKGAGFFLGGLLLYVIGFRWAMGGMAAAAKQAGVEIDLQKVTDIAEIMSYGMMSTPGVVIDDRLVHCGGNPGSDDVQAWVTN